MYRHGKPGFSHDLVSILSWFCPFSLLNQLLFIAALRMFFSFDLFWFWKILIIANFQNYPTESLIKILKLFKSRQTLFQPLLI